MYDALVCGLKHLDHLYKSQNKSQATTETGPNFEGGGCYVTRTTHIQYIGPKIWLWEFCCVSLRTSFSSGSY